MHDVQELYQTVSREKKSSNKMKTEIQIIFLSPANFVASSTNFFKGVKLNTLPRFAQFQGNLQRVSLVILMILIKELSIISSKQWARQMIISIINCFSALKTNIFPQRSFKYCC